MATEVLLYLTYLAVILLIGLLTSIVSQKFRIPNILLLLLIGMGLGKFEYNGAPLIHFPGIFMTSISILTLVMIVFDSYSRLKINKFDYFSMHALWLSVASLIFNTLILSAFAVFIFSFNIFHAVIFSALMLSTIPNALPILRNACSKLIEFLMLEGMFNSALALLLPFAILDIGNALTVPEISQKISGILPLLQSWIVGIAAGVLVWLVMFKFIGKRYSSVLSPLAVITSALLAYTAAESLNGSGIFAAASMGILFGAIHISHKPQLHSFATVFSSSLEILIFVLIGIVVPINFSYDFFIRSILLFAAYFIIRLMSILFALRGMSFNLKEKIFMAMNMQKGIAAAAAVFYLANLNIEGIGAILNLAIAFMLYSIILSGFAVRAAGFFIPGMGNGRRNVSRSD